MGVNHHEDALSKTGFFFFCIRGKPVLGLMDFRVNRTFFLNNNNNKKHKKTKTTPPQKKERACFCEEMVLLFCNTFVFIEWLLHHFSSPLEKGKYKCTSRQWGY